MSCTPIGTDISHRLLAGPVLTTAETICISVLVVCQEILHAHDAANTTLTYGACCVLCSDSHDNPPQQALLHPLLQSLDFKLPASLQTTERVQNASNNHASPAGMAEPTPSNNSSKKQQPGHNLLPCTAQSAAALAQALRRNPAMLLGSNSTGQLLASLATEQQREQLRAHQRMGLLNPRQRLQEHGVTTGHNAVSGAYSHSSAAQIAPFAKPQRHPARPVTPHKTKPYRSGSVKQPACNALEQQSGKPAAQAAGVRVNSHRPLTAGDNRACKVQQPSSALERPSTATMIRPGSAAASKLLRSMEPGSPRRRPDSAAGGMSCSTGGQLCQNLVEVIGGPAITNDSSSTASLTDNHQQQQGSSELESSRPTTAAMRALLMSRSGHDPAVLERLAWYARINSANDSTEGLDIVHETAEDDDNETQGRQDTVCFACYF